MYKVLVLILSSTLSFPGAVFAASLSFSPANLNFHSFLVGTTASLTFSITNNGADSIGITLDPGMGGPGFLCVFEPNPIRLAPGGSSQITMRVSESSPCLVQGHVSVGLSDGSSIIGPPYTFHVVQSELSWWPKSVNRSFHEGWIGIMGTEVSKLLDATMRVVPDSGIVLRRVYADQDSFLLGIKVDIATPLGRYNVLFEKDSALVAGLDFDLLPSLPWIGPPFQSLDFSPTKQIDTLTVRGGNYFPGCTFTFDDTCLTLLSSELFPDTLARLIVRLDPGAENGQVNLRLVNLDGGEAVKSFSLFTGIVSVEGEEISTGARLPRAFALGANYPNPFNPSTTITYRVPEGAPRTVSLKVYNLRGQLVSTLVDNPRPPGEYSVVWNAMDNAGRRLPSGVYLYRMSAGEFHCTRKMVLLK